MSHRQRFSSDIHRSKHGEWLRKLIREPAPVALRVNMTKPTKFRKKPVVIEAVQYDGANVSALVAFSDGAVQPNMDSASGIHRPTVETLEGAMRISMGDYLIKGVKGEFYPCKEDIFEATYDVVTA